MPENDDRSSRRRRKLRQAGAWAGAAAVYAAAQGLSTWAAQRQSGRGTRPQYSQFERPAFAPPGAVFPVAWSALNLTTATSAWRIWRAPRPAAAAPSRGEVLAWWAAAVVIRSGYVPLAFGRRRLWAATADAALLFAVMSRYALLARRVDQPAALLAVPSHLDGVHPGAQPRYAIRPVSAVERERRGGVFHRNPSRRRRTEPVPGRTPGMGRSKASSRIPSPLASPGAGGTSSSSVFSCRSTVHCFSDGHGPLPPIRSQAVTRLDCSHRCGRPHREGNAGRDRDSQPDRRSINASRRFCPGQA